MGPKELVLLNHGENNVHDIWLELRDGIPGIPLPIEIANIRDKSRMNGIFQKHRPDVVFHAVAYKHVPLMELHPAEAVKTNVLPACARERSFSKNCSPTREVPAPPGISEFIRLNLVEVATLEQEIVKLLGKGLQCSAEDIFSALGAIIPRFRSKRKVQVG